MILVTGGTGLVGAHLLFKLTLSETKIRATYRPKSNLERVKNFFLTQDTQGALLFEKIEWIEADINNLPQLEEAFEGIDRVYHCAALISFDPRDFRKLKRINVRGTANVINLSLAFEIDKLCYVSSIAAFSSNDGKKPITEENEWLGASNVYGLSKYLAEMEVWRGAQEGLAVVIVNPGVIIGSGFWDQGSGAIFRAAAGGPKYFPPGGTGFVTATDVVQIMIQLMNSDIQRERYILVDRNLSYETLLKLMAENFHLKKPRKKLKLWQLNVLWRLDWLWSALTGNKRKLTRDGVRSLNNPVHYSNSKIKNTLAYQFEDLPKAISDCCTRYLSEVGINP